MSDDEEVIYKKPTNTIHYGSLEETERLRQNLEDIQSEDEEDDYEPETKKPAIAIPTATATATVTNATVPNLAPVSTQVGNINISNEYFELEQEM